MISRKLAGVSAASVGAATAAAALLLGTVPGSAVSQPSSFGSAYGVAASGALSIDPLPRIAAPPDGEDALLEVAGVGVLKVAAADHASSATATEVALAQLVDAELIKATCENGVGAVSILNGSIVGTPLPSAPAVGEPVDVSPILSVELNRQTNNPDGTLTVDALVLSLLPGAGLDDPLRPIQPNRTQGGVPDLEVPQDVITVRDLLEQLRKLSPDRTIPLQAESGLDVVISSATCGAVPGEVPVPGEGPAPGPAPAPEVVETQLPVTH